MKLQVISHDHPLLVLCREIAWEMPSLTWQLVADGEPPEYSDADLCLWDYKCNARLPNNGHWGSQSFVLVDLRDLAEFREVHPYAEAGIVLKPVTRAVLRALVSQIAARLDARSAPSDQSLRSDRDEILQCLMHANLQLQQYDAERTNFLGRALHDFHAPLSALSGYCGLLLEGRTGFLSDEQKLIIRRMQHSVRRLARMSKAMFQLSVGRRVSFQPLLRVGDIRDCAEQSLYEVQGLADEKELQLELKFEPLQAPLLIDSGKIEQVLINLLENACKFSRRGGTIAVKGYSCFHERRAENVLCPIESDRRFHSIHAPNVYRIDISDSGDGISPEQANSIFEEYVSYAEGQDRSRGGLGLAICRTILQQHRGQIWAQNCQSGAMFSFILPFEVAYGAEPAELGADLGGESVAACVW